MKMYEIEDIILGMADLVLENRALRKENNDLRLECATHDALMKSMVGGGAEAKKRYEILSDIRRGNSMVSACHASGWQTNERYTLDWEAELERRMNGDEEE